MLCGLLGGRKKRGHETAVLQTVREQALVQPAVPGSPATQQVQLCHLGRDAQQAVPCSSSHHVTRPRGSTGCDSSPTLEQNVQGATLQRFRACTVPKRWHLGLKHPKCISWLGT